jgi:hypothetical protein
MITRFLRWIGFLPQLTDYERKCAAWKRFAKGAK